MGLQQNKKLRILNIDSNQLQPLALEMLCRGLSENQTLEQLRCNNVAYGYGIYEAIADMVKKNGHLVKIGMEIKDAHFRNQIDKQIMRNNDEARKRRVAAKKAAESKAAESGYPVAT